MITCPDGHIYDETKNKECPFCKIHSDPSYGKSVEKLVVPEVISSAPTEKKVTLGYRIMRETLPSDEAEKAVGTDEAVESKDSAKAEASVGEKHSEVSSECVCPAGHTYDGAKHSSCPVCAEIVRQFYEQTAANKSDENNGVVAIYSLTDDVKSGADNTEAAASSDGGQSANAEKCISEMKNVTCPSGHIYDSARHESCPFCKATGARHMSLEEIAAWDSAAENNADIFREINAEKAESAEKKEDTEKSDSIGKAEKSEAVSSELLRKDTSEKAETSSISATSRLMGTASSSGRLRGTLISSFGTSSVHGTPDSSVTSARPEEKSFVMEAEAPKKPAEDKKGFFSRGGDL